VRINPCSN
jgi:hypothetical protein